MNEDTLLDTFVDVEVRGQAAALAAVNTFTAQVKRAFGDVAVSQGLTARTGVDAVISQARRATGVTIKEADKSIAAAESIADAQEAAAKRGADGAITHTKKMSDELKQQFQDLIADIQRSGARAGSPAPPPVAPPSNMQPEFDYMLNLQEGVLAGQLQADDATADSAKKTAAIQITAAQNVAQATTVAAKQAANATIKEHARAGISATTAATKQERALDRILLKQTANNKKAAAQSNQTAIQLGQAFEDAAVGFSLDGVKGALRGAANNINFLIAGLAQSGQLAAVLGTSLATAAPLIFAAGTALAFVLPTVYEWFAGTEKVKDNLTDIAELLQREFAAKAFGIKLDLNIDEQLRSILEAADSVSSITDKLRDSNKAVVELREQLQGMADNSGLAKLDSELGRVNEKFAATLKAQHDSASGMFVAQVQGLRKLEDALKTPQTDRKVPGGDEESQRFQSVTKALTDFQKARDRIISQANKKQDGGLLGDPVDEQSIAEALKALTVLDDNVELLKSHAAAEGGLLPADMDTFVAGVSQAKQLFDELNKSAAEATKTRERLLSEGLSGALKKEHDLSSELEFQHALNKGLVTEADKLLVTMLEQERSLEKQNKLLLEVADNSPSARGLADANATVLQLEHQASLMTEIREIQEKITAEKKKTLDLENDAEEKRLKQQQAVDAFIASSAAKTEKAKQALQDETQQQARKAAEESLQDQIAALSKVQSVSSQRMALGDIGQTVFGDGDSDKKRLLELQAQLEALRDKSQQEQDAKRIAELEAAVKASEEDRLTGLLGLSDANKKIEEDVIKSQTEAKEATDKLTTQLKTFEQQLLLNTRGQGTTVPGVTDKGAMDVLSTIVRSGQPGFGQPAPVKRPPAPQQPAFNPEDFVLDTFTANRGAAMSAELQDQKASAAKAEAARRKFFADDPIRDFRGLEGLLPSTPPNLQFNRLSPPPDIAIPAGTSGLEPQWMSSFGSAQAEANARAFENSDFTSSSLEKLLANSNTLLERVVSGVASIDTQSRFT